MADAWEAFPTQMAEHPAFISFNNSYAEIAEKDPRTSLFRVRVQFKQPTAEGLPPGEEFPELRKVEDLLEAAVLEAGGVQVGRLTVNCNQHFYFYVGFQEEKARSILDSVAAQTAYELQLAYEDDPAKEGYWKGLYPTADDWQVIRDMRVLDALREKGDISTMNRGVSHWAYFPKQREAQQLADWANANGYTVNSVGLTDDKTSVAVRFTHDGTMQLADITSHTIAINRKARELGGEYDGWETSVECKQ